MGKNAPKKRWGEMVERKEWLSSATKKMVVNVLDICIGDQKFRDKWFRDIRSTYREFLYPYYDLVALKDKKSKGHFFEVIAFKPDGSAIDMLIQALDKEEAVKISAALSRTGHISRNAIGCHVIMMAYQAVHLTIQTDGDPEIFRQSSRCKNEKPFGSNRTDRERYLVIYSNKYKGKIVKENILFPKDKKQ